MEKSQENKQQTKSEPQSYAKRDWLRGVEKDIQAYWAQNKMFEMDAPEDPSVPKYVATFPYPYMNGRLHLGHAFTLSKCEFEVSYQRLKGKNALFPFGFHCTGMPIMASADKIKREIQNYGNPPQFPAKVKQEEPEEKEDAKPADDKKDQKKPETKGRSKKAKVVAKTGDAAYQWDIMKSSGVPTNMIDKFADPYYWLDYFPPLAITDLNMMGAKIDWRRTFITTDKNPYYDAFVRWQFEKLKKLNKVQFGKRFTIYSPLDAQPCMDHDRASGEGVMPQEYVLVKQQLLEPFPAALSALNGTTKKVYLVPATLRPETMYGQTNVWVLPDGKYGAFEINDNEIFICTERSAINLSYQGHSHEFGKIKCLASFTGKDLIGAAVKAPLTKYDKIYVWPMFSVSTEKTTGVVTSVPSDSPDDFVAWRDVQQKQQLRDTFKLTAEQVNFEVVPIINIPDLGDKAAENVVTRMKINGQGDRVKLDEAKEIVYKAGFYEGTMTVGPYAGEKVEKAKEKIRSELLASGQAIIYSEPEAPVVSRSGDTCVVALVDQWYLTYGEEEWCALAEKCLSGMTTYDPETRTKMEAAFKWMHQWACSRTYGLGTKLPWDPSYLIESLSDSTIYMAYYTIAHLLQGGVMDGSKVGPAAIKPEQLTYEFFEHIFCDGPAVSNIPADTLAKLKKEFAYWYPVDLRASGKDLIPNHLIFWVYNHVAIFPEKYWPKSVRTNGHLLRDKEKMSKSKGNFLILHDAVEMFSADGMRFALADAGDSLEDANFSEDTVNNAVLKLYAQYHWIVDTLKENAKLRAGAPTTFADKVFESKINKAIELTDKAYTDMAFHDAVKTGFYELQTARDNYVTVCQAEGQDLNKELIERFIRVQVIMISPVTPHWAEHIWRNVLNEQGTVTKASWPSVGPIDNDLLKRNDYLMHTLHNFRLKLAAHNNPKKGAKPAPPTSASIYIADRYPEWQEKTLVLIRKLYNEKTKEFPANKEINDAIQADADLKAQAKKVMPFVNFIKEEVKNRGVEAMDLTTTFSEKEVLQNNIAYVCKTLEVKEVIIYAALDESAPEPLASRNSAEPGKPLIFFK